MAILDEHPGLEVQILVHDHPLREYQDHYTQTRARSVERYVEAQSGANFEVRFSFQEPFPPERPVAMVVTIDGKNVEEPIIRPFELFDPKGHVCSGPISKTGSNWVVQKYCFSPLEIREDGEDNISDKLREKLQSVGVVTCEFYFLKTTQRNHRRYGERKEIEEFGPVSEKVVKGEALSHQTVLREKVQLAEAIEYYDAVYADDGKPFATFRFYYRSLAALKDLHIIEFTPDPVDLLENDDSVLGQLNREQLEAIVRRFREQEETRLRMKREGSFSGTVVGVDNDIIDNYSFNDPDIVEIRSTDLRETRKARRKQQLPNKDSEVIVLE